MYDHLIRGVICAFLAQLGYRAGIRPWVYVGLFVASLLSNAHPHPATRVIRVAYTVYIWYWANAIKYDETNAIQRLRQKVLVGIQTWLTTPSFDDHIYMYIMLLVAGATACYTANYTVYATQVAALAHAASMHGWSIWPVRLLFWVPSIWYAVVCFREASRQFAIDFLLPLKTQSLRPRRVKRTKTLPSSSMLRQCKRQAC